jgi:hypothetical protein
MDVSYCQVCRPAYLRFPWAPECSSAPRNLTPHHPPRAGSGGIFSANRGVSPCAALNLIACCLGRP